MKLNHVSCPSIGREKRELLHEGMACMSDKESA